LVVLASRENIFLSKWQIQNSTYPRTFLQTKELSEQFKIYYDQVMRSCERNRDAIEARERAEAEHKAVVADDEVDDDAATVDDNVDEPTTAAVEVGMDAVVADESAASKPRTSSETEPATAPIQSASSETLDSASLLPLSSSPIGLSTSEQDVRVVREMKHKRAPMFGKAGRSFSLTCGDDQTVVRFE